MEVFATGFGIGFALTIMVGPITLTIIDSSLGGGWKAGAGSALAMWISDVLLITLIYVGGQEMIESIASSEANTWINYVAGAILLCIGVVLWFMKDKTLDLQASHPTAGNMAGHVLRGFLVNTFSPFTILFWPTLIAGSVFGTEMTHDEAITFFTGIMTAIILGDTAKVFLSSWIRSRISQRYMRVTRLITSVLFTLGGIYLIAEAIIA